MIALWLLIVWLLTLAWFVAARAHATSRPRPRLNHWPVEADRAA